MPSLQRADAEPTETCLQHLAGQAEDFISLADVVLVVEYRRLPVHSGVLAQHSAWFRALFASLKEGLASSSDEQLVMEEPFNGLELHSFCSFLRCVYSPTPATVRSELVQVREEEGEVLFDYHVETLLALALKFDVPTLFTVIEHVAAEEPSCRLALLMDPLRWLLVCDEYQHLGHLHKVRSTAISFLTAKFSSLQTDPRLDLLSAPTLAEVVRMAAFRLSTLASSCGHVQAVQDRAAQRFTATAQQVASGFCPDASQAASYVTHWWLNPTTNSIKLSWSLLPEAASNQEAAAPEAEQEQQQVAAAAAAAAPAAPQQAVEQQQAAAAAAAAQPQPPLPLPYPGALPAAADMAGWAQAQTALLQQALGQMALLHHHHHPAHAHPFRGLEGAMSEDEEEEMGAMGHAELAPLLQAAGLFMPPGPPAGLGAGFPAGAYPAAAAAVNAAGRIGDAGPAALLMLPGAGGPSLLRGGEGMLAQGAIAALGLQAQHAQQGGKQQGRHHARGTRKSRFHPY